MAAGASTNVPTSHAIRSTVVELSRNGRTLAPTQLLRISCKNNTNNGLSIRRDQDRQPASKVLVEGPSCIFVGPIENASQETLEALYRQAMGNHTDEVIKHFEFGGSIPVDNIQSLASKDLKHIPIRYVQPEIKSEQVSTDESLQIPVIDLNKLSVAGQPGYEDELAKLHVACRDWGFFQLINHGISEGIDAMKKVTEELFKMPLEKKMKCAHIAMEEPPPTMTVQMENHHHQHQNQGIPPPAHPEYPPEMRRMQTGTFQMT